jgi:hypothetical protein
MKRDANVGLSILVHHTLLMKIETSVNPSFCVSDGQGTAMREHRTVILPDFQVMLSQKGVSSRVIVCFFGVKLSGIRIVIVF